MERDKRTKLVIVPDEEERKGREGEIELLEPYFREDGFLDISFRELPEGDIRSILLKASDFK